jgi:hypothetical protein
MNSDSEEYKAMLGCYLWNLDRNEMFMGRVARAYGISYNSVLTRIRNYKLTSEAKLDRYAAEEEGLRISRASISAIASRMATLQALADYEWNKDEK